MFFADGGRVVGYEKRLASAVFPERTLPCYLVSLLPGGWAAGLERVRPVLSGPARAEDKWREVGKIVARTARPEVRAWIGKVAGGGADDLGRRAHAAALAAQEFLVPTQCYLGVPEEPGSGRALASALEQLERAPYDPEALLRAALASVAPQSLDAGVRERLFARALVLAGLEVVNAGHLSLVLAAARSEALDEGSGTSLLREADWMFERMAPALDTEAALFEGIDYGFAVPLSCHWLLVASLHALALNEPAWSKELRRRASTLITNVGNRALQTSLVAWARGG